MVTKKKQLKIYDYDGLYQYKCYVAMIVCHTQSELQQKLDRINDEYSLDRHLKKTPIKK